jgi:hypothetical protein
VGNNDKHFPNNVSSNQKLHQPPETLKIIPNEVFYTITEKAECCVKALNPNYVTILKPDLFDCLN